MSGSCYWPVVQVTEYVDVQEYPALDRMARGAVFNAKSVGT